MRSRRLALSIIAVGLAIISAPVWATFPGTNGRIAFSSNNRGVVDIYTMNPDGSGIVNVTNAAGFPEFDLEAAWSPDGTKIAFRSGARAAAEIYTMNTDGTAFTRLTFDSFRDRFPAWSPDGSHIAFESNRSDPNFATCIPTASCKSEIFVMPATGGSPVQLTFEGGHAAGPRFSPDGRFIAYATDSSGTFAVYKVDVDTLAVIKLTTGSLQMDQPDWSPDGTKITFVGFRLCSTEGASNQIQGKDCKGDIFVMNADGTGITQLTHNFGNNLNPRWSPQGDRIVFQHGNNQEFNREQIYVMNPDGTGITRITHTNDESFAPDWGPR